MPAEGMVVRARVVHQREASFVTQSQILNLQDLRNFAVADLQLFELSDGARRETGLLERKIIDRRTLLAARGQQATENEAQYGREIEATHSLILGAQQPGLAGLCFARYRTNVQVRRKW